MRELDGFFLSRVEIPAMRQGRSQAIETMINEELLLLTKYLRNENTEWTRTTLWLLGKQVIMVPSESHGLLKRWTSGTIS